MTSRASLSALKALNHARRASAGLPAAGARELVSDLETAIDAADRSCGYDRTKNYPQPAPFRRGERDYGRPSRAVKDCLAGSRCDCARCRRRVAARLELLRARAEAAAGDFDVRPVLASCRSFGRSEVRS